MENDTIEKAVGNIAGNICRIFKDEQRLSCALSEPELVVRGDELASQVKKLAEMEKDEAERRKEAKDEITGVEREIAQLAQIIKSKSETREVMVIGDMVSTAEGEMVRLTRSDTGEVIGYRLPTAQERQAKLNLVC